MVPGKGYSETPAGDGSPKRDVIGVITPMRYDFWRVLTVMVLTSQENSVSK